MCQLGQHFSVTTLWLYLSTCDFCCVLLFLKRHWSHTKYVYFKDSNTSFSVSPFGGSYFETLVETFKSSTVFHTFLSNFCCHGYCSEKIGCRPFNWHRWLDEGLPKVCRGDWRNGSFCCSWPTNSSCLVLENRAQHWLDGQNPFACPSPFGCCTQWSLSFQQAQEFSGQALWMEENQQNQVCWL